MKLHLLFGFASVALFCCCPQGAAAATQVFSLIPVPTVKANVSEVCTGDPDLQAPAAKQLDRERLAGWFFYNNSKISAAFPSAEDFFHDLANPTSPTITPLQSAMIEAVGSWLHFATSHAPVSGEPAADFAIKRGTLDDGGLNFFHAPDDAIVISCNAPTAPHVAPSIDLTGWRIRGNSDSLIAANPNAAGGAGAQDKVRTAGFTAAAAASFSLSQNDIASNTTGSIEATLGRDIPLMSPAKGGQNGWRQADLIPFVGADVNLSATSGKASASDRENIIAGVVASGAYQQPLTSGSVTHVFAGTYAHYWNEIDNSQLNFFHLLYQPYVDVPWLPHFNELVFFPGNLPPDQTPFKLIPQLNLLADDGTYNDRGLKPKKNVDYLQVGGMAGLDLTIIPLNSEVTISETYLFEAEHGLPDIHLFQVAWTLNLSPSFGLAADSQAFGLKASYQDGVLEATHQATKQWSLAVTAKY